MRMVMCPRCGRNTDGDKNFCIYCGLQLRYQQMPYQNQQIQPTKKKESTLSTLAAVFSILTITIPISVIIAIIDLAINRKNEKHTGSVFSLIWCFFVFLVLSLGILNGKNSSSKEPVKIKASEESQLNSENTSTEENMVTYEKTNVRFLNYQVDIDNDGRKIVTVYYEFENNSSDTVAFGYMMSAVCFENGVEADTIYGYSDYEDNILKEIKPGANIKIAYCFVIKPETNNVTVDIRPIFDNSALMSLEIDTDK